MSTEAEFAYLAHLPTYFFKRLVNKWEDASVEFKPNGLLSSENRETTMKFVKNMKDSRIKQLRKLAEVLDISDVWWEVYQISKTKPLSDLKKRKKNFSVEKYFPKEFTKIKGIFSIKEISEHAILILIEFSSRSMVLKRIFRSVYLPSVKTILLEPKDLAMKVLQKEVLPFITKEPNEIKQKLIRARTILSLTKNRDEGRPSFPLTHLKIKISLETSGIEGLSQIIIQGDNVLRGAETLEQRHEISLKFMNSGPWVGAGTKDFMLEVRKGIQIHQLEEESLKNIATVLSWI
ncbi:MAG: hypothetical protein ACXADY_01250 [Candidatus Hodarchaeales archaeon]|jgi:hypothetical protein